MFLGLGLALAIATQGLTPPPTPKPWTPQDESRRTVAVVRDGRPTLIITTAEAKSLLRRSDDPVFRAALQAALMVRSHHCDHTPTGAEIECFDR